MNWKMLWDAILDREPEIPPLPPVREISCAPCAPSRAATGTGTQRQRVTVNQSHIANGRTYNPDACMVHLALADVGINARVGGLYIHTADGRNIDLPASIARRIEAFDHHERVKPFTFEIVRSGRRLLSVGEAFTVDYASINRSQIEVSEDGVHWFTVDSEGVYR